MLDGSDLDIVRYRIYLSNNFNKEVPTCVGTVMCFSVQIDIQRHLYASIINDEEYVFLNKNK